jgi:hypothetical protein
VVPVAARLRRAAMRSMTQSQSTCLQGSKLTSLLELDVCERLLAHPVGDSSVQCAAGIAGILPALLAPLIVEAISDSRVRPR